jgi:hypothetical protein
LWWEQNAIVHKDGRNQSGGTVSSEEGKKEQRKGRRNKK